LNIHHLELFYHVATHRGITAAARRMPYGIQQPAISGQLAQLERSLGTKLFHRRPFGFTAAGIRLFQEIESFFSRIEDLPTQVRGVAHQRLRLAAPTRILRDYLPKLLHKYKRSFPNFEVTLHDVNQADAEQFLTERKIDIAITELRRRSASPFQTRELLHLPLALIVRRNSRFRRLQDFFRDHRATEKLISLIPDELVAKQFQSGLRELGLHWTPSIEVSLLDLVDIYTSLGFGVGLSLVLPGRKVTPGLRLIPLRQFEPLTIAAMWLKELTPISQTLLEDVTKIARRIQRRARS
jgi:DNA-binding transcriptional LysR family regulator